LSDGSAAYIKKGGRNPVIGYKPQLVRSGNGFVTSLIVPEGNAVDSIKLEPAIRDSIRRIGVIATLVSTDDGYASAKGRDDLRAMGVQPFNSPSYASCLPHNLTPKPKIQKLLRLNGFSNRV